MDEVNQINTVIGDRFYDVAFVVPNDLFQAFEYGCDEYNSNGDYLITGYAIENGEYLSLENILLEKSTKIKFSELTAESIKRYQEGDNTVYMVIRRERDYKTKELCDGLVYAVLDILAPNVCISQRRFALDRSLNTENEQGIYLAALNTRGKRTSGISSIEPIEIVELEYADEKTYKSYFRIIDDTVFVSTDNYFDNENWVEQSEGNYIYYFSKYDGACLGFINPSDSAKIKYIRNSRTKESTQLNVQLCPLYKSGSYFDKPYDEKYIIKGIVLLGGNIFDTEDSSFLVHDRYYVHRDSCFIEEWGDGEYLLDDTIDGEYEYISILRRTKSGSLIIDEESYKLDDGDEEE